MATPPVPALTGTITVSAGVERAFAVFTGSIDTWWPRMYHIGRAEMAEAVLEPRRFTADGPGQTTVELEHRLLERLGDGQAIGDAIRSGGGWTAMLELFAKAAADAG
jgi:hypothetical protein